VGSWFDKDYDPHGPCGPTAFWKISDRESKSEDTQVNYHDFLPLLDGAEPDDYDEDYEPGPNDDDDDDDEEEERELEGFMAIFNTLSDSE